MIRLLEMSQSRTSKSKLNLKVQGFTFLVFNEVCRRNRDLSVSPERKITFYTFLYAVTHITSSRVTGTKDLGARGTIPFSHGRLLPSRGPSRLNVCSCHAGLVSLATIFSAVTQRSSPALRDDTRNGCE